MGGCRYDALKSKMRLSKCSQKKNGYIPIDMHVHTNSSNDCKTDLQSIIKKAKKKGIGIAITDHQKIGSAIRGLANRFGCLVIPGIEIFTKDERHVLFYFYGKKELIRFYNNEIKNSRIEKGTDELLELKKKYKCIAGLAHPTGHEIWHNLGINYDIKKADFLEVLNGRRSEKKAIKTYRWAMNYKKGLSAGSDAHTLNDVGKCVTYCKGNTIKEALDSIKAKETFVTGVAFSTRGILKKIPKDMPRFAIWCLAKAYNYSGLKKFIKPKK